MNIKMDGISEFVNNLTKVYDDAEVMFKRSAYNAAGVVADEVKAGLKGLRTAPYKYVKDGEPPLDGVTKLEKSDLIESMGISKIESRDGLTTVSVGFDGYGSTPTKKYPQGLPNQLLMRSVESGTSFRRKQPVIRPAINRSRTKIDSAIKKAVTEFIESKMN